jgi:hypothetical protein
VGLAALNAALDGVAEDWLGIGSPRWVRSSGTDGHLQGLGFPVGGAVKIALRLSMRLPVECSLAACLTPDRPCAVVLVRRWRVGRRSRLAARA